MKQIFLLIAAVLLGGIVVAHPLEFHLQQNTPLDSGSDLEYEFRLTMPFAHFGEGHILTGSLLVVLWASLFYTLFSLAEPFFESRKEKKTKAKEKEEEEE